MAIALFPFMKPNDRPDRVLGRDRDAHMHMIRHQMSFHDLAFLLLRQRVKNRSQVPAYLAKESGEWHSHPDGYGIERSRDDRAELNGSLVKLVTCGRARSAHAHLAPKWP